MGIVIPLEEKKDAGLDNLLELIRPDLERTNQLIIQRTGSDVTTIPEVANHLISAGGKRLRPMLVLATASMCGYKGDGHLKFAAGIEFMHTATLLHDDVVDEATCAAARSPRACCGATRPACSSATSCSATPSR